MSNTTYLIDANSLITPYRSYYQFTFFPTFWDKLKEEIECGHIAILDMVKLEISKGKDELSEWLEGITANHVIDRRNEKIVISYQEILEYLRQSPCYKPSALAEWSRSDVADPWLVASAKTLGFTIITFETSNPNLNNYQPSKYAKIPDVARVFDVEVCNLFEMMNSLGLTFR